MSAESIITLSSLALADGVSPDAIPAGFFVALAERMERAMTEIPGSNIKNMTAELTQAFEHSYRQASGGTRKALRDEVPGAVMQAFRLGQLSFAQALAAKAADRRVPDTFVAMVNDFKYVPLIQALLANDLSGNELAVKVGESPESISRKLQQMRTAGITDCWREGRKIYNHLTTAARAALLV